MRVAAEILDYIRVLIWPCFAFACLLLVKPHLAKVIGRITAGELKFAGVQVRAELYAANETLVAEQKTLDPTLTEEARSLARKKYEGFFAGIDSKLWGHMAEEESLLFQHFLAFMQTIMLGAELLGLEATNEKYNRPGSGGAYEVDRKSLIKYGIIDEKLDTVIDQINKVYRQIAIGERDGIKIDSATKDLFIQTVKLTSEVIISKALDAKKNFK